MKSLFSEFRRRNVFRVAALYLVSAWLIAQVADVVIGLGELPTSIGRVVLVILALGFPVTLVLSWFLEWTPQGIRLESEASPGQVAGHPSGRRLDYIIIALLSVALAYFASTHDWGGPPRMAGASIAVLPFENRSAQPDDVYFTDGIHDDILTQLSKISALVVISRTSVMQYRDSTKTIPEIARELGVATILEGGVQRAGDRVRVNLQLIEAANDRHLWAETYDRKLTAENVFAIQSEIATSIADILHAKLLPQELARIETAPTRNLEAYDAYLLGRRAVAGRNLDELNEAREYFEKAIDLDPDFALAYASLASTLGLISAWGGMELDELLREADAAAREALELNPNLGEAHTALGVVMQFRGDPEEDYAPYLERGVQLSPNSADARKWYSGYLSEAGRDEEALEQLLKAVQLDPMSPIIRVNLAGALHGAGRHEEADAQVMRALEIDPGFQPALMGVRSLGTPAAGFEVASKAVTGNSASPWVLVDFVLGYLELRDEVRAEQWLALLDRSAEGSIQSLIGNLNLSLHQGRGEDALHYASQLLPLEGAAITVPSRTLLLEDLRRGNTQAAIVRYENKYPDLLGDDPVVTNNYSAAIDVAMLMQAIGESTRAKRLLDRSLQFMSTLDAAEAVDFGIFEARALALEGRKEESLAAIRKAIDAGWRFQWWFYMEQDPALDSVRNDARFTLLAEEMNAMVRRDLAEVREFESAGRITLPMTD